MQIFKVSLIASLAGAMALQLHAQSASPEQQNKALELLRQMIAQSQPPPNQPSSTNVATAKAKPAKSSATKAPPAKSTTAAAPSSGTNRPAQLTLPTTPAQPAGPKTKQQRLMDLLDLYKADKITPAEYHAQRAKILSEP